MPEPSAPRRRIILLSCLGMAAFGIVLTVLGASLPVLIERFAIDKTQAGALLSLMSFGVLAGSLVFGPIVDWRGYRGMLLLSFAAIVVGLEAVAFAPSLAVLRAAVLLIGFTGGLVNGGVNALSVDVATGADRASLVTYVGAFFGVGAAGVPFVLATFSGAFSQSSILAVSGALVLVPLAITAVTEFPPSKQPHGFPAKDASRLLRDHVLLLIGVMLFLESGVETTAGGWIPTLFADELNVSVARAPLYLSLFWLGLLLGRLGLSGVLQRTSAVRVMLVSIAVATVASLLLVATRTAALGGVSVFLLGAGFASTFPVMFAVIGNRYAQLSGTALSLAMGMALTGGMLLPYLTGIFATSHGLRASFLIVPVGLVLLAALLATLSRRVAPAAFAAE